ncbi:hypothetical protein [Zooshikella sp. RANM57]|uniref:hypothetical protein n=1 Tax=Zooshikella sp. RANM57 TaxID=3425863 RepID=UPI003D6F373B
MKNNKNNQLKPITKRAKQTVSLIYKYIEYYKLSVKQAPEYIRISKDQYICLDNAFNNANHELPATFEGIPFIVDIGPS